MTSPNLTCSVVICTRDRPEFLEECLRAVKRQDHPAFDIWVIDNASGDDRTRLCAEKHGVRYAHEPRPGLSRARNLAARCSTADILAYTDDDAIPEPGWLSALAREFQDPQVMAACGRVIPANLETEAARLYEAVHPRRSRRLVVTRQTLRWFELTSFGGIGDGNNMAFRRSAFLTWPGFDERLGLGSLLEGNEEHKAMFELVASGGKVVYTPDGPVRHPHPSTPEGLRARFYKELSAGRGYVLMLLVEHPEHRGELLSYVMREKDDTGREWLATRASSATILPLSRRIRATFAGVSAYVRTRIERRTRVSAAPAAVTETLGVAAEARTRD